MIENNLMNGISIFESNLASWEMDGRIIYQHKMKNETQGCYGTFLWTTVDGKHPAPPCAPSWMVEILSWDKPPIN